MEGGEGRDQVMNGVCVCALDRVVLHCIGNREPWEYSKHNQTAQFAFQKANIGATWLAQLEEHVTLDLGVMGSSPTLGAEIT